MTPGNGGVFPVFVAAFEALERCGGVHSLVTMRVAFVGAMGGTRLFVTAFTRVLCMGAFP